MDSVTQPEEHGSNRTQTSYKTLESVFWMIKQRSQEQNLPLPRYRLLSFWKVGKKWMRFHANACPSTHQRILGQE